MKNELILFETADKEIKLNVSVNDNTVWLNRNQLAELFERDVKTIGKHINNALKEELDNSVVANFATTASDGKTYQVEHYNLDMIISVGYRVKSNRGVEFRKWANKILKQYIIQGYAINEKRLEALQRTVSIQTKMLASTLEVEEIDVLKAVNLYTEALMLLDQYDHQSLNKPEGSKPLLDGKDFRISCCTADKINDRVKALVWMVEQDIAFADIGEDIVLIHQFRNRLRCVFRSL